MTGRLLIGTSGWSYDDWVGRFYPEGMARREWLSFYATRFPAVEVNASFYRLPFQNMVAGWSAKVPEGFVFAVKGSRVVTHRLRLREVEREVLRFHERMKGLKGLEVVLWQLPPSLKRDEALVDRFLEVLPPGPRRVIEFRHPSWWESEGVLEVLRRHRTAFCGVSHPRLPADIPDTADFAYVRFHGLGPRLYDYDYSMEELRPWVEAIARILASGRDAYVFFNNDYHANAVQNANSFRDAVVLAATR